MKANRIVKENIAALIRQSGLSRKDVAQWCHKSESWISKVFKEDRREFANSDMDRIADLFGIDVYRLYQPGVARTTERRKGSDRRASRERRVSKAERLVLALRASIEPYRQTPAIPEARHHHGRPSPEIEAEIRRLTDEFNRAVDRLLSESDTGRQTPPSSKDVPAPPARHRTAGRSDAHDE
jgi:hypothetical protein